VQTTSDATEAGKGTIGTGIGILAVVEAEVEQGEVVRTATNRGGAQVDLAVLEEIEMGIDEEDRVSSIHLPPKIMLTLDPQIDERETTDEKETTTVGTVEVIAIENESVTNEGTTEDENGEMTKEIPPGETIEIHLLGMISIPRILDHQLR